eukprot:TRINITY_DN14725_c0_g1_i1.p1 TRINITY_DN14725_c0_g1~~TRINITY_DN14725_c0_g1_i1.p1  ORF type:complete len:313 (-),score=43.12 TRINITY_DN14725_c0_g1_i1:388-1326(-)
MEYSFRVLQKNYWRQIMRVVTRKRTESPNQSKIDSYLFPIAGLQAQNTRPLKRLKLDDAPPLNTTCPSISPTVSPLSHVNTSPSRNLSIPTKTVTVQTIHSQLPFKQTTKSLADDKTSGGRKPSIQDAVSKDTIKHSDKQLQATPKDTVQVKDQTSKSNSVDSRTVGLKSGSRPVDKQNQVAPVTFSEPTESRAKIHPKEETITPHPIKKEFHSEVETSVKSLEDEKSCRTQDSTTNRNPKGRSNQIKKDKETSTPIKPEPKLSTIQEVTGKKGLERQIPDKAEMTGTLRNSFSQVQALSRDIQLRGAINVC